MEDGGDREEECRSEMREGDESGRGRKAGKGEGG